MDAQEFFDSMRFFGEPKIPENADKAAIYGAYARGLGQYSGDVLRIASDNLLRSRNHRNFPLLAECLQACREAHKEILIRAERERAKSGAARESKPSADPWSEYRIRQADRMMNSDIGRLAAEEGWIVHLHDWCRENARLPNRFEGEKVRATGLGIRADREHMARGAGASHPIVKSGSRALEAKRSRLVQIAVGNSTEDAA